LTESVRAGLRASRVKGVIAFPPRTPAPGVVVLHEISGVDAAIKDACDRLADAGYVAFAPDLYSRQFRPICIARTLLSLARNEPAPVDDLHDCLVWLRGRPEVDATATGAIGFCMGGGFALAMAVHCDVGAAAVNYGGVPASADELAGICPIVASYGSEDHRFVEDGRRLDTLLGALGVIHDVRIYDGATHSFMNNHRGHLASRLFGVRYDRDSAEDAWRRTLEFLNTHLRSSA
jgi:carboxymethylenebutenolidase